MNMLRIKIKLDSNNSTMDNYYIKMDLSKYDIDFISKVTGKKQIFEGSIKFTYNKTTRLLTMFRPLTTTNIDSLDYVTIDFISISEERNLKIEEILK